MVLKDKMIYYIGIWENLEADLKVLNTPCINRTLPFDWALEVLNFSCSSLYSMISTDHTQAPTSVELKTISNGLVSDFVARSEEEYINKKWWENESIIERAKKWIEFFEDMHKLLNENLESRLGGNYENP